MNASKYLSAALVAVAAVSASSAFAADDNGLPQVNNYVSSSTSRAAVQTDLQRAYKAGELNQNEARNLDERFVATSQLSREQVRAELSAAAKAGTLNDLRS
ncbi:DUF4148 domain-containing protein [Variovorax sp. HJSM1_2]|uniref:DUF4148 domain-containing protein n=1 Tax=Variovorax sp. HJSM1_2 TaxID=3366263 RepID=UPI003BD975A7